MCNKDVNYIKIKIHYVNFKYKKVTTIQKIGLIEWVLFFADLCLCGNNCINDNGHTFLRKLEDSKSENLICRGAYVSFGTQSLYNKIVFQFFFARS